MPRILALAAAAALLACSLPERDLHHSPAGRNPSIGFAAPIEMANEVARQLIAAVTPGSPAARSGLRAGDIVTAVNRRTIRSVAELTEALQEAAGAVALNVMRDATRLFIVLQ